MRKITIKASKQKPERGALPFWALLFLLAGVFGVLSFLADVDGVAFSGVTVFALVSAVAAALWLCDYFSRKLFWAVFLAAVLCCAYAAFRLRAALWTQMQQLGACFTQQGSAEVTLLATLGGVVVTLLFYLVEFILRGHFWLWLLTTALLLAAPFANVRFRAVTAVLLVLFQTSFWALHTVRLRRGGGVQLRTIAWKSGLAAGLLAALLFAVNAPLTSRFSKPLYQAAYAAEGFVTDVVQNISGSVEDAISDGSIGRGNNYQDDVPRLKLTAAPLPPQTLYLCGFIGDEYLGGEWKEEVRSTRTSGSHFRFNYSLRVLRLRENDRRIYQPYNSRLIDNGPEDDAQSFIYRVPTQETDGTQTFLPSATQGSATDDPAVIAEQGEITGVIAVTPPAQEYDGDDAVTAVGETTTLVGTVSQFTPAVQAYSAVPEERLPRLTELAEETPLTNLNEITAFILYTLHSNTTYSLTPGWAPMNTDVVEAFLFDRGTGYCVHYASAAVLLYRLYGIPARYASGYCISPSQYSPGEDVTNLNLWECEATDKDAHAWVEIQYGNNWVPVEVTTLLSEGSAELYPGFDYAELQRILDEKGWDMSKPSLAGSTAVKTAAVRSSSATEALGTVGMQILWVVLGCLALAVLLLPPALQLRRLRSRQRLLQMRTRQIFTRLLRLLHECKLLTDCDGTEADFALRLTEAVPAISEQEARELMEQVNRAAYGNPDGEPKDTAVLARALYRRAYTDLYALQPRRKRLTLKFLKGYG